MGNGRGPGALNGEAFVTARGRYHAGMGATAIIPGTRSVYLETFGCQMNGADSEVVLARLEESGWRFAPPSARQR